MKNLKNLVHAVHAELKKTTPAFKKNHVYELISAYCGYGSYAAYKADLLLNKVILGEVERAQGQCFDRALALGVDVPSALLSSQIVARQLDDSLQDKLQLEKIVHLLDSHTEPDIKSILNSLRSLIDGGLSEARLLAIVICADVIAEHKENLDNRSGEYWHCKRLSGAIISPLQTEAADNYFYIKDFLDLIQHILTDENATMLPSPIAIRSITGTFEDEVKREWTALFGGDPHRVLDALGFLYDFDESIDPELYKQVFMDWLGSEIITNPNRGAIDEKITHSTTNKEKWFWHFIGLNHNIDITQDDLYAINADTGEEYDDYGPMDVVGFEGGSLPEIAESDKSEMKMLSNTI